MVSSLPSSVLPVGHLRLARPFNWEGRNVSEDSGAFLALWRGPSIRRVGIGANLVPMAAAQMPNICPPGQTFVIAQGKCVAAQPAVRCPEGQEFDAQTNRCVTARSAVRCPGGQEFDARANRCVTR